MIRPARHQDIPLLLAMLHEMHADSKYAGRVDICEKVADALLTSAIATHGQFGPQATHIVLSEDARGCAGFMLGSLDRVYHIGNKLVANDAYLYVRSNRAPTHVIRLIDDYIAWALAIRAVIEIRISWTDTLPGAEKLGAIYGRKGFSLVGEIWEMRLDMEARRIAA